MAVDLKFIDENGDIINLATGIDLGVVRKGVPTISKFKIKNEGDLTARETIIMPTTLNDIGDDGLTEEELDNQNKAIAWKTFSKYPDKNFVKQLNLGDIKPNSFAEGDKSYEINFESEAKCQLKDVWNAGTTEFRQNRMVFKKLDNGSKGQIAKRIYLAENPSCRDFEIDFNVDFSTTVEGQEVSVPFIAFPVRINSNGDGKGYIFLMHYRRDDGKYKVTIYKGGKGMASNMDRDYGDPLFDTIQWLPFDKTKKMTFKIYNNKANQPTFEVKYDGQNVKLGKSFVSSVQGYVLSDTATNTYNKLGNFYGDFSLYDGDYYLAISNMIITVDEPEAFIYIKSTLGDNAENKTIYNTAATLSYLEN